MSLPVSIHWCSLVPNHEQAVRSALRELSEKLNERRADLPQIELSELSSSDQKHLPAFLKKEGSWAPDHRATPLDGKRVFVFCTYNYPPARRTRDEVSKKLPEPKWGVTVYGRYAFVWEPENKFIVWHEAMHLLWADDCYNATGQTTCEESCCIMQYIPCEKNCCGDLHLCSSNVRCVTANLG